MNDSECVAFLQWALPQMEMRWAGFRRVRRQVRRRINARMRALAIDEADGYRAHLEAHPEEWAVLDGLCRVTISRFHRNRGVFAFLFDAVVPELTARIRARGSTSLRAWSLGCASGEEAYTLAIGCERTGMTPLELDVLATDADTHMLARARAGVYPASSLRDLPDAWRAEAFTAVDDDFRIRDRFRHPVTFRLEDVRTTLPEGPFDLVLCRNLVFTYYTPALQQRLASELSARLVPGGALVLGHHEVLPDDVEGFEAWDAHDRVYRRTQAG